MSILSDNSLTSFPSPSSGGASLFKNVRGATTAALAANTYANGSSGFGATLTGNANGAINPIDGLTLAVADRLLVKNEVAALGNGIYVVTQVGTAGTPYILTRASDFDIASDILPGTVVTVAEGTVNADLAYLLTANAPIVVGTTALTWAQFGAGMAIGSAVSGGTTGSVLFVGSGPVLGQDNANFFWDDTNNQLLLGDGSAANPSYGFVSQVGTGFYKTAITINASISGTLALSFTRNGTDGRIQSALGTNYLELASAGGVSLFAAGTNQNITLTPSGTGMFNVTNVSATAQLNISRIFQASTPSGAGNGPYTALGVDASTNNSFLTQFVYAGGTGSASNYASLNLFGASNTVNIGPTSVLFGTATNSSNGRIQFATHTTSAGGIGLGVNSVIYTPAAGGVRLEGSLGSAAATGTVSINMAAGTTPALKFQENGSASTLILSTSSGDATINAPTSAKSLILQTQSTTALTLDSSQNATFAHKVTLNASGGTTNADALWFGTDVALYRSAANAVTYLLNSGGDGNFTFSASGNPIINFARTGSNPGTAKIQTQNAGALLIQAPPSSGGSILFQFTAADTASSGAAPGMIVAYSRNQTSTAGAVDFTVNRTSTAVGSGTQQLATLQINSVDWYTFACGRTATTGGFNSSSTVEPAVTFAPIINQTSTAGYTALKINPTETATGSGVKLLLDLQVGGTSKFNVDNLGVATGLGYALSTTAVVTESTTSRTLTAADNGKVIQFTNGSAKTVTVNTGLADNFSVTMIQVGAGAITFAGTGTIVNRSSFTGSAGTNAVIALQRLGSGNFVLAGDCA